MDGDAEQSMMTIMMKNRELSEYKRWQEWQILITTVGGMTGWPASRNERELQTGRLMSAQACEEERTEPHREWQEFFEQCGKGSTGKLKSPLQKNAQTEKSPYDTATENYPRSKNTKFTEFKHK